jgi:hypothetical protein
VWSNQRWWDGQGLSPAWRAWEVRVIKPTRMRWTGHVACMEGMRSYDDQPTRMRWTGRVACMEGIRSVHKVSVGESGEKRPLGGLSWMMKWKCMLNRISGYWLDWCGWGWGPVAVVNFFVSYIVKSTIIMDWKWVRELKYWQEDLLKMTTCEHGWLKNSATVFLGETGCVHVLGQDCVQCLTQSWRCWNIVFHCHTYQSNGV